jgi:hypothetical protein
VKNDAEYNHYMLASKTAKLKMAATPANHVTGGQPKCYLPDIDNQQFFLFLLCMGIEPGSIDPNDLLPLSHGGTTREEDRKIFRKIYRKIFR